MLPPFTEPLADVTDPDAWRGGKHRAPEWRRRGSSWQIDTPGVHALVRAANLPRAELLHMGWTDRLLSASAPEWLCSVTVAALLGRIVADARYDRGELMYADREAWTGDDRERDQAFLDGNRVVCHWFSDMGDAIRA